MRKLTITLTLIVTILLFQFCSNSKKLAAPALVTYEHDVLPLVQATCEPCHIAGKGNKKSLDNYANAKDEADDIIRRIQLKSDERGFMPMKHPKLSDTNITAFVNWKKDGLLEK